MEAGRARQVAIIGCGYVGYPLALLLVDAGHTVSAVDTDPNVVTRIASGNYLSHEPGLEELAESVHATGRLTAFTTPRPADVFIIAVPTPLDSSGREADLSALRNAARSVASVLRPGGLVIVESTVPPGTTENVVAPILGESGLQPGTDFHLAHCPERVFPGNTLEEMRSIARVVGGIDDSSTRHAAAFFGTFVDGPITNTNSTTAELVKLMENTYRDVNIALANQIADIAETYDVDPSIAISIANQHPRVSYLNPGIGVGGHCIPVDPWFLVQKSLTKGVIEEARNQNDQRPAEVAESILAHLGPEEQSALLLGVTYKPNASDVRNSPALTIRHHLEAAGVRTDVFDPLLAEFSELKVGHATAVLLVPHPAVHVVAEDLVTMGIRVLDASTGSVQTTL